MTLTPMNPPEAYAASSDFGQFDPPPLCNALPVGHEGGCVHQPDKGTAGNASQHVLVDMPTMDVNTDTTTQEDVTGQATFTITQQAARSGYSARPPSWVAYLTLLPVRGRSTEDAAHINMYRDGDCAGQVSCTYTTGDRDMAPGWYHAFDANARIVQQRLCPPSPSGIMNCTATESESAVYVPREDDLHPPRLATNVVGNGVTTKAVAAAEDPEGKSMTLSWDFGDGSVRSGQLGKVATHTYAAPGDYKVTARVTTSDGRYAVRTMSAGLRPTRPVLQTAARAPGTTEGVVVGSLPGWPEGASAFVSYWTDGCPAETVDDDAFFRSDGYSNYAYVQDDGTVSMPVPNLKEGADAFVMEALVYVDDGGQSVELRRRSTCMSLAELPIMVPTTEAIGVGATTVPVPASTVPIGNVAIIDALNQDRFDDLSEQRVVKGHGSLIVEALDRAHGSGALVVDAGVPVKPYTPPAPPQDPAVPEVPGGGGGPDDERTAPKKPMITKVVPKRRKHQVVVKFSPRADGGAPILRYQAKCKPVKRGEVRKAVGSQSPIKVKRLTKKKPYRCQVRAKNEIGFGKWSKPSPTFKAK